MSLSLGSIQVGRLAPRVPLAPAYTSCWMYSQGRYRHRYWVRKTHPGVSPHPSPPSSPSAAQPGPDLASLAPVFPCNACPSRPRNLRHTGPILASFPLLSTSPEPTLFLTVLHFRSRARNLVGRCALSPTSSRHDYLLLAQSPRPKGPHCRTTPSKRSPASTLTRASPRSSTFSTSVHVVPDTKQAHSFFFSPFFFLASLTDSTHSPLH